VATHFGLGGYADKWSTLESALYLMGWLGLLLPLLPAALSFALRYVPVDLINIPNMQWLSIQAHQRFPVRLPPGAFITILAGFLVAVAMWAVGLIRRFRFPRST
jgi:hypothetical protein